MYDVLLGQGVGEVALDGNGLEVQKGIVLENGPDEGRAAVDAAGGGNGTGRILAGLTVDDQDLVGRAATIALQDGGERHEGDRHDNENDV